MMQGDAYSVPVVIKAKDGTVITPEMATRVEITMGHLTRQWPGVITFNEDTLAWEFPLTQQQSFRLSQGKQKTQVRVAFSNGWVVGGDGTDLRVLKSESKSILPAAAQQAKTANVAFGSIFAEIGAITVVLSGGLPDIDESTKGKYLTNDGEKAEWADIDALPAMSSDTAGKMLTNDGEKAEWGGAIRYDVAQNMSADEQLQARKNIGGFPGKILPHFFDGSAHDNDIFAAQQYDVIYPGDFYNKEGGDTNQGMAFPVFVMRVNQMAPNWWERDLLDSNGLAWYVVVNSKEFTVSQISQHRVEVLCVKFTQIGTEWKTNVSWDTAAYMIENGGMVYAEDDNGVIYPLSWYQAKTDDSAGTIQFYVAWTTNQEAGSYSFNWLSDTNIEFMVSNLDLYRLPYVLYDEEQELDSEYQAIARKNIGLDQVDNTSDANKPVSTAQEAAIKVVQDALDQYKTDVGNGTVIPARATSDASGNNIANTYATKQELANLSAVQIRNKDEVINATQETVQTVATAYMVNNYGRQPQNLDGLILTITDLSNDKILYIYSAVSSLWINAGINGVDLSKYVGVAQQTFTDAEKAQARQNIGAGTSSFSGSYNDLEDKPTIPSKTSDLTNDSGYVNAEQAKAAAPVQSVAGKTGAVTLAKGDVGLGNVDNVKQYSVSNPPPYPVTSVNGQTGAVQLNIPDAYTLPVASSTQLGGVKPVAKTDAMTKGVGVDTNGGLYTEPGAWYVNITGSLANLMVDQMPVAIWNAYSAGYAVYARVRLSEIGEGVLPIVLPLFSIFRDGSTVVLVCFAGSANPHSSELVDSTSVLTITYDVRTTNKWFAFLDTQPTALPNPNALTIKVGDTATTYDGSAAKTVEVPEITETETIVSPAYTNQIPLSTDSTGAIFGDAGYKSDSYLDTTGTVMAGGSSFVTGYIPCKKGDIIRIKDSVIDDSRVLALYPASKPTSSQGVGKTIANIRDGTAYGSLTISGNELTWDTSSIAYYFWSDFAYLRATVNSASAIITINEEIVDVATEQQILRPGVKVKKANLDFATANPILDGKTVVCFGDSIFGMTRDDTSVPAYAAQFTGAKTYNVGFGGCRMSVHPTSGYAAFSMWALADAVATGDYTTQDAQASSGSNYFPEQLAVLKSIDFNAVDMIVIHYGTNDFAGNVAIDNASDDDDTTTLCGALRYSLRKLQAAYPKIRIFVSLPIYRKWGDVGAESYENSNGKKLWDFCAALAGVAAEFNCPAIDGYRALGINAANDAAFSSDGTHLNDHGRQAFGELIGGNLIASIPPAVPDDNPLGITGAAVSQYAKISEVDADGNPTKWEAATVENGADGKSAYGVALDNGFSGTEDAWLASLHAADPVVLALSAYPTESDATTYMDAQTDHSKVYVWNNKVYCYTVKGSGGKNGACLYGYRASGSSGIVSADGKALFIIPVEQFTPPLSIEYTGYTISNTPYIYGGTVPTAISKTLISNDLFAGRTDPFEVTAAQLGDCKYVMFAVTATSKPSAVTVKVNDVQIGLTVIESPSEIDSAVSEAAGTVYGYADSGVVYGVTIGADSTQQYLEKRDTHMMPVPRGYCETKLTTYQAGAHYLSMYDYATMTSMLDALATANPDYITVTTLGKDASNTYDIKSYVLDAPSSLSSGQTSAVETDKPVVIITSGLHGVEPDAVHTVYHFMADLCDSYIDNEYLEYLHYGIKFVIIPICNPWGYVNQSYYNSNDVDINKNFGYGYRNNGSEHTGTAAYSEAETQHMRTVFDAYPDALMQVECHGKYGDDTAFSQTIWFSLMRSLNSPLIELSADTIINQIGRRLANMGYQTNKSKGGYITYYGLNGRPKDYTGSKYGMLSLTMEGTGKIYGETTYSVNAQKINCEALENFVLRMLDGLGTHVKV